MIGKQIKGRAQETKDSRFQMSSVQHLADNVLVSHFIPIFITVLRLALSRLRVGIRQTSWNISWPSDLATPSLSSAFPN